jgi:hypothetical protein
MKNKKFLIYGFVFALAVGFIIFEVALNVGWLMRALTVINALAFLFLVYLTYYYASKSNELSNELVNIEKKRDEEKVRIFQNILLAEFRMNKSFIEDLINELQNNRPLTWKEFDLIFLGFTEKGFDAFRNQGGFQHIDTSIYDEIAKYYVCQYKIHKRIEKMIVINPTTPGEDRLGLFIQNEIIPKIIKLKEKNEKIQTTLSNISPL